MFITGHPDDNVLEEYAMGRSSEPMAESIEEHFLICENCQDRLALADAYVKSMKNALASIQKKSMGAR